MAGKQVAGDGLSSSLAGMSKNQLYDIMCQMKTLIEQNQQQARQILIQNPVLTKALFQAQIMLGMVQPPNATPNVQPAASQSPQPSASPLQPSNTQAASSMPGQTGLQEQSRKKHQPVNTVSSASNPPTNLQPPAFPPHSLPSINHQKGNVSSQSIQIPLPQSSQLPNIPPVPHHSASQPLLHLQQPMSATPNQLQQPVQTNPLLPLQPPLPRQPRPPMTFPHQVHPQMGPNVGFQHSLPQLHHQQPTYHSGGKQPVMPGQPQLPVQQPSQAPYQVGASHLGPEFNQAGSANQGGVQLPGPPQFPGHMGPGNQPPRQSALTPEMEQALLQQVMSLTPEQINMLPPEQRNQVIQLQQMLHQ